MSYTHGAYGELTPTTDTLPPGGVATLPVYIGTAPVFLTGSTDSVNTPVLVSTFDDAVAKVGYKDDWGKYTLCEAIYAHFKNRIKPIGPIVLINVLDPQTNKKSGTTSVTLTNGEGYISKDIILSSVMIEGKTKGTDYSASYTTDGRVLIKSIGNGLTSPVTVAFDEIDLSGIDDIDIIGGIDTNGKRSGIACIDLIYQKYNMIPTILAAPGWSHIPEVKEELAFRAQKINGHWDAAVVADIDSSAAKTISVAKTWKDTNAYTDRNTKICWPKAKSGDKTYWLSTLTVVRMQQTDSDNDDRPFESPSNKPIDITGTIADGSPIEFDEIQANELNAKGITTAVFRAGNWVLWGPHNSNYEYGKDIDIRDKFDASIRMMMYLTNSFQARYMQDVDSPLNRAKVDTILNDSQLWLNSLVADEAVLYAEIQFNETSNPEASVVEGDFVFDIATTTTPVGKSLKFRVQYTTTGISTLFGGEE